MVNKDWEVSERGRGKPSLWSLVCMCQQSVLTTYQMLETRQSRPSTKLTAKSYVHRLCGPQFPDALPVGHDAYLTMAGTASVYQNELRGCGRDPWDMCHP